MKFTNILPGSKVDQAANDLLKAAHQYWIAFNSEFPSKAVVWLQDTNGQLVVMTRGEYTNELQEFVSEL